MPHHGLKGFDVCARAFLSRQSVIQKYADVIQLKYLSRGPLSHLGAYFAPILNNARSSLDVCVRVHSIS